MKRNSFKITNAILHHIFYFNNFMKTLYVIKKKHFNDHFLKLLR